MQSDAPCGQLWSLCEVTSQNKTCEVPSAKKGFSEVAEGTSRSNIALYLEWPSGL